MTIPCNDTPVGDRAAESLAELAFQRCIPVTAVIELTLRCNLRCLHCYNFDREQPYPKAREGLELGREELLRIVDELCDAGCLYLAFTGGEALAHPYLTELVRRGRQRRAYVRVKTNGTLLTEARTRELLDAGVGSFDVSLYGGSAETHDTFTLDPGSFDASIRGVETVKRLGGNVRLSVCLTRLNVHEIETMLAFEQRFDSSVTVDMQLTAREDGERTPLELRLDATTLEQLYRGPLTRFVRPPDPDPQRSVQCNCARGVVGVSSVGEVYPCIGAPVPSGNLRQNSFADIWANSPELNRIRDLTLDDFSTCKVCPDRPFCARSSGVVYYNTGDYTGPEAFTCMEAGVRRKVFSSLEG